MKPSRRQRHEPEDLRSYPGEEESTATRGNILAPSSGGIWLKKSWADDVQNISVLVAIDVNDKDYREVFSVCEGGRENADSAAWSTSTATSTARPHERKGADSPRCLHRAGETGLHEYGMLAATGPRTTAGICRDLKKTGHSPSGACRLEDGISGTTQQKEKTR